MFLFIYFRLHCVFVVLWEISQLAVSQGYSSLWCSGFSLKWLVVLLLQAHALGKWVSGSTLAQLIHGIWTLPRPRIKLMSLALAVDSYPLHDQEVPNKTVLRSMPSSQFAFPLLKFSVSFSPYLGILFSNCVLLSPSGVLFSCISPGYLLIYFQQRLIS